MEMLQTTEFWVGLVKIIWINIILSGDNAVVIALAARSLPPHQQRQAVFFGSGAAVVLRIILTVVAAKLLGRSRHASRFATAASFASYCGVAPIEVASADRARHRLPRGGDRQLNLALHIIALTQVRMRRSTGRAYYDTKIASGKSHNEAMRCLKRRLADHVWRLMVRDERTRTAGPGGHSGASLQSSAAGSTPTTSSSDKSLPEPAEYHSTTQRSVA
jgi:hypothetical protein